MKRSGREINIFGTAMLDLFASGMGAFIIITIILFPYYGAEVDEKLSAAKKELEDKKKKVKAVSEELRGVKAQNAKNKTEIEGKIGVRARLFKCGEEKASCQIQLAKNFLIVQIEWEKNYDVNLHVTDPAGHEYFWMKPNRGRRDYSDSSAHFTIDFYGGPGAEVWLAPVVMQGDYQVSAKLSRDPDDAVEVKGYFFDRTGRRPLAQATLAKGRRQALLGTIRIKSDGSLEMN